MTVSDFHATPELAAGSTGRRFAIATWFWAMVHNMQVSRMIQVYSQMSDETLASLGITRRDIPNHAAKLLEQE